MLKWTRMISWFSRTASVEILNRVVVVVVAVVWGWLKVAVPVFLALVAVMYLPLAAIFLWHLVWSAIDSGFSLFVFTQFANDTLADNSYWILRGVALISGLAGLLGAFDALDHG
jgi:hypothetical protein